MKYAVVYWYNYRKELTAGFMQGFDEFEKAKDYAYNQAKKDFDLYKAEWDRYLQMRSDNVLGIITEDDITDNNGPGKSGSPYYGRTIIGYGGRYADGYSTTFYCVVEWFDGVENNWNDFETNDWEEEYGSEWYPEY